MKETISQQEKDDHNYWNQTSFTDNIRANEWGAGIVKTNWQFTDVDEKTLFST